MLFTFCLDTYSQPPPYRDPKQLLKAIEKSKSDTNRIALELELGSYYLFKPGAFQNDMDSTINCFNQALKLSEQLHNENFKYKTLALIGNYHIETGDTDKGIILMDQACQFYQKQHDFTLLGKIYLQLGALLVHLSRPDYVSKGANYYGMAINLYSRLKWNHDLSSARYSLADFNMRHGNLDTAEQELLSGIKMTYRLKDKFLIHHYEYELGLVYFLKGMYYRSLYYQLKVIADYPVANDFWPAMYWSQTSITYQYLGMYDNALYCSNKVMAYYRLHPAASDDFFTVLSNNIKFLLALNKPQIALDTLTAAVKRVKPINIYSKGYMLKNFGQCYAALHKNELAGKYYDDMMAQYAKEDNNVSFEFYRNMYINNACSAIDFFINTSQFKKANLYFQRISPFIPGIKYINTRVKVLPLQFKLDSASGKYKKAFEELTTFKRINDSIYNSTKSQQIAEMQTRYDTRQKEQSIALLKTQSNNQHLELKTVHMERNVTLAGVVAFMFLTVLGYNRYRYKQKTNLELEAKQIKINKQNESQLVLLTEKDRLIEQKDWLLREVHHRVKNNLHTVNCLLQIQSEFLKGDALKAIENSQRRIFAMSLIHQKLYLNNEDKEIDIADYLPELVKYLKESLGVENGIRFIIEAEHIMMNISVAVPLGLILNEGITNAVKYAFPASGNENLIYVKAERVGHEISVRISDNGIGLPSDKNVGDDSLGLKLIKGLCDDIHARCTIETNHGTNIIIVFKLDFEL